MAIQIRDLEIDDEQQLRAFHEAMRRAEEDGRDWNRAWTFDEMAIELRDPSPTERAEAYAAWDGDTIVGASVHWFFLADNLQKTWLEVFVDPAHRRRGVGSALVEFAVDRARVDGRTQLTGDTSYAFDLGDEAPAARFARKHGFRVANVEIVRMLPLPVDEALLDELQAESAPHHGDYDLESYVDVLPDALLPSYCALHNLLAVEAPGGEFDWEPDSMTPEIYLDNARKMSETGRTRYTTVAVRDGVVVALTDLVVTKGEDRASQWFTIVDRAHRGHRLGAAVKVANLRQMTAAHPELVAVRTSNAETNANMVGINDRLGFAAVALAPGFLRDL